MKAGRSAPSLRERLKLRLLLDASAPATTPITYIWDFGDDVTTTVATASVQHTYTVSGTKMVRVTAYNPCTLAGVTHQESIIVAPLRIFLPLVFRNY